MVRRTALGPTHLYLEGNDCHLLIFDEDFCYQAIQGHRLTLADYFRFEVINLISIRVYVQIKSCYLFSKSVCFKYLNSYLILKNILFQANFCPLRGGISTLCRKEPIYRTAGEFWTLDL